MAGPNFIIDLRQEFPHLDHAPIVEAVIHWQARPEQEIDSSKLNKFLIQELPEYLDRQPQHNFEIEQKSSPEGSSLNIQSPAWCGFRCATEDGLNIAQFTRSGLVFSRLKPYENWEQFVKEAKRVWGLFQGFARPSEIGRLGVRFINLIESVDPQKLGAYLRNPPGPIEDLPLPIADTMYQRRFQVPGHPYFLNVIQVLQPTNPQQAHRPNLILDLDVFTSKSISCEEALLDEHLSKLRWIKNKAFFSLVVEDAVSQFGGEL